MCWGGTVLWTTRDLVHILPATPRRCQSDHSFAHGMTPCSTQRPGGLACIKWNGASPSSAVDQRNGFPDAPFPGRADDSILATCVRPAHTDPGVPAQRKSAIRALKATKPSVTGRRGCRSRPALCCRTLARLGDDTVKAAGPFKETLIWASGRRRPPQSVINRRDLLTPLCTPPAQNPRPRSNQSPTNDLWSCRES